jgi:nicotinamide riboside kinase
MKIAFCGRGGTGKTTLANQIARRLNLPLISESVRTVCGIDLGGIQIRNMRAIDRLHLQIALMQNQITTERLIGPNFVSDRSVWDYYAYTAIYSEIDASFYFSTLQSLQPDAQPYDYLILVPPFSQDPAEDDGFRFSDIRMINHELDVEDILRLKADYILESKTLDEREDEVVALVENRLNEFFAL